jgi:hypothetical protein
MSNDEPVFADEPASKKGMSTTAKVVLVMLGVGGVALLLCCGGLFGAGIWLKRTVEQAQVTNPVQVRELAGQIASIEIPEGYAPLQGLQLPMVGMRMVTFTRTDQVGANIFLMENNMGMNPSDPAQRDQMLDQFQMQQGAQGANLTNVEVREIEVAGQKVPFQFGNRTSVGVALREVVGFVPLKKGVVLVVITDTVNSFDEEAIIKILQSIGEPGETVSDSANAPKTDGQPAAHPEPTANPAPADTATPETTPPNEAPVEAEQPEPATVPQ